MMFCPRCASEQSDELKFCKSCGANLEAVRQVLDTRETTGKIDWSKTWVADMFLSPAERRKREQQLELQRGITPEVKRRNEIKGGVITACAGAGVTILLYVLMQGIILSGRVAPGVDEILSRLWVAGIIPILVGAALIINGILVSKKQVPGAEESDLAAKLPEAGTRRLEVGDTNQIGGSRFSVTEGTTKHLDKLDADDKVN